MIGRFVSSKAGHDKNRIYVVVACDGEFVSLCDGEHRTCTNPKRKRVKHIQIINQTVDTELFSRLLKQETRLDEQISFVLKEYQARNSKEG